MNAITKTEFNAEKGVSHFSIIGAFIGFFSQTKNILNFNRIRIECTFKLRAIMVLVVAFLFALTRIATLFFLSLDVHHRPIN